MCGLCREGRWFEAYQLAKGMGDQRLSPDEEIYNSLVLVYSNYFKVDLALETLNTMTAQGFKPCLIGYRALICALCKIDKMEEAQSIFENMLLQHWNPDEIVWTILIDGLLKDGKPDLCMKFLHIMEAKNCKPTFQTYVILAREVSKEENRIEMVLVGDVPII